MIKDRVDCKYCVFCLYWEGEKAKRSVQPKYWEYNNVSALCRKKRLKVHSTHKCSEFQLNKNKYHD